MALETAVNTQITDSVTQASLNVLSHAPALSLGNLYHTVSQSLGLSVQNAVFAQQHANMVHQAVTTQGVNLIYSIDTEAVGDASTKIAQAAVPAGMIDMLSAEQALAQKR